MTNEYRIAVIAGDGIGQEVMPEGLKVLRAAEQTLGNFRLHFEEFPWGAGYYLKHGRMLPLTASRFWKVLTARPASPAWRRITLRCRGLLLEIRKSFEQSVNIPRAHPKEGARVRFVEHIVQRVDTYLSRILKDDR